MKNRPDGDDMGSGIAGTFLGIAFGIALLAIAIILLVAGLQP